MVITIPSEETEMQDRNIVSTAIALDTYILSAEDQAVTWNVTILALENHDLSHVVIIANKQLIQEPTTVIQVSHKGNSVATRIMLDTTDPTRDRHVTSAYWKPDWWR